MVQRVDDLMAAAGVDDIDRTVDIVTTVIQNASHNYIQNPRRASP
mgnify:CR=1 FL=1